MSDWQELHGYGQPAHQMLTDAVISSIRAGNLSGSIEMRVSPSAWERCLIQLSESRRCDLEQVENRAAIVTHVCGRKVRVIALDSMKDPDAIQFKDAP